MAEKKSRNERARKHTKSEIRISCYKSTKLDPLFISLIILNGLIIILFMSHETKQKKKYQKQ